MQIHTELFVEAGHACGTTGHALLLAADVIVLVFVLVVSVLFVAAAEGGLPWRQWWVRSCSSSEGERGRRRVVIWSVRWEEMLPPVWCLLVLLWWLVWMCLWWWFALPGRGGAERGGGGAVGQCC